MKALENITLEYQHAFKKILEIFMNIELMKGKDNHDLRRQFHCLQVRLLGAQLNGG